MCAGVLQACIDTAEQTMHTRHLVTNLRRLYRYRVLPTTREHERSEPQEGSEFERSFEALKKCLTER